MTMPTFEEHRYKCNAAREAQLTLQAKDSSEHADWIVITAFYQALHRIDAFFALDNNFHPLRHGITHNQEGEVIDPGRNLAVKRHKDLAQVRNNYANLYDASCYARYQSGTYQYYPDEVRGLLEIDLAAIDDHVNALIGRYHD